MRGRIFITLSHWHVFTNALPLDKQEDFFGMERPYNMVQALDLDVEAFAPSHPPPRDQPLGSI